MIGLLRGRGRPSATRAQLRAAWAAELADPGCLLCREEQRTAERYWFWFCSESYSDPDVLAQIANAGGFCSQHAVDLAGRAELGMAAVVHGAVVRAAAAAVAGALTVLDRTEPALLARRVGPQRPCPACTSIAESVDRRIELLRPGLADPEIAAAAAGAQALCVVHATSLVGRLSPAESLAAIVLARRQLAPGPDPTPPEPFTWARLAVLAGRDSDATRRRPGPAGLSAGGSDPRPEGCPVCAHRRRAEGRWIAWAADELGEASPSDPAARWGCRRHLWACARAAPSRAPMLAEQLTRILAQALADEDGPSAAPRTPAALVSRCRRQLDNRGPCRGCRERQVATVRRSAWVAARLLDPAGVADQQAGTGSCWRDLPHVLAAASETSAARTALVAARAQLAMLTWELDEVLRKQSWDTRHEAAGAEGGAAARAAAYCSGFESGLETQASAWHPRALDSAGSWPPGSAPTGASGQPGSAASAP